ncbi:hypothetical protein NP233_g8653 [Leucocoprinus birnbaumii]|uniref:FAD dependent oxidoreductase domain-containing protein n=1 Tax=Leucocoprinus birnbaumii TaxID=56174 RepID=A0AAD5VMI2_9AGAR|nr:hypothetical protein NP233_g8653 [Leucocoprinus birnbaumii]
MSSSQASSIIIVGGGIIGCTTAYYLSKRPGYRIILLEASKHGVAQGASGKAGGLVAKWAYPKELVNVSFREHVALAEKLDGASRWGWRYVGCGSWEGRGRGSGETAEGLEMDGHRLKKKSLEKKLGLMDGGAAKTHIRARGETGLPEDLTWVSEDLTKAYSPMAPMGDTAQVYPYEFTSSMLELAQKNGVEFLAGRATAIQVDGHTADDPDRRVIGVEYQVLITGATHELQCSHVILTAGAWSPTLVPSLPIAPTRAHSITLLPSEDVVISPYVLFTEIQLPPGPGGRLTDASPEI